MTETTFLQGRAEWVTPRRAGRRREAKVAYRNSPGYSTQHRSGPSGYASSPDQPLPQNDGRLGAQTTPEQSQNSAFRHSFDVPKPPMGEHFFIPQGNILHQRNPAGALWLSPPSTSHTSHLHLSTCSQGFGIEGDRSAKPRRSPTSNHSQEVSWNQVTPRTSGASSEPEDLSFSEFDGSLGSFDSMLPSVTSTVASSISEGFVPLTNPDSAGANHLDGLVLPGK